MIFLISFELLVLVYCLGSLVSMRSLVVGEGTWTKTQKDAVHNLYQYAYTGKTVYYENFKKLLDVTDGDKQARLELLKPKHEINLDVVRAGFIKGQVPEVEIDGVINFLQTFGSSPFIQRSVYAWDQADRLILELRAIAEEIKTSIDDKPKILKSLERVGVINDSMTYYEKDFSASLVEGSRWMENILRYILSSIFILVEGIGIFLIYKFGKYLVGTINQLKTTADEVGRGNFMVKAPALNLDELGQLGLSLNSMIESLNLTTDKQKQTEDSLNRSNERFALMVEAVKDYAIFSLDLDGRVRTWNSGAEHIKGYTADEIIGHHFSIFYTTEDRSIGLPMKELLLTKKHKRYEREVLRVKKGGSRFWANVILNSRYDKDGEISGFSMVTRDITERKEYELQLQKNNSNLERRIEFRTKELQWRESQLRQITNALPEAVCQVDRDEIFLFVNESFCNLLSKEKTEVIGRSMQEIFGSRYFSIFKQNVQKVLQSQLISFDLDFQKDGWNFKHNITLVPELDENANVHGFILVAHDIRKYKEIEFELKKAKELAVIANETKSAFLANMSHEIRTPLGAILGFSELILNNEISESQKNGIAEAIKRNGQLLSNVINDILDLSKVEAGKLEIEKVSILFDDIIKDIESLLNLKATEKGIKLSVSASENLPLAIKTDPLRLRQILLNIVGNAIKFTQKGEVNIRIKSLENSKLAFIVQDTGTGMTPEQSEKLFAPFSQADVSTTRKFGGSGLGLILSRKLAVALGGDVTLDQSELNKGSTFTVTIDTGLGVKSGARKIEMDKLISINEQKDETFDFSNLNILLVEDSLDNQFIITHFLKSTGATLKVANNGLEGVQLALAESFDLVLLDLQMPIMGGLEAIKKLNQKKYRTPVIALTAHAMKEDRKQCLKAGFKDHLSKPVNRQALLRTIHFWTLSKNPVIEIQNLNA